MREMVKLLFRALNLSKAPFFQVGKHFNCKFPAYLSDVGATADKLI